MADAYAPLDASVSFSELSRASINSRHQYRTRVPHLARSRAIDWAVVVGSVLTTLFVIERLPVFVRYISEGDLESLGYPLRYVTRPLRVDALHAPVARECRSRRLRPTEESSPHSPLLTLSSSSVDRPNSFPSWALLPGCLIGPLLVLAVCQGIFKGWAGAASDASMALLDPSRRTSSRGAKGLSPADRAARASALHHATIGLVTSVALALFITVSVKLMVGRPRPDFLARCSYPGEIPEPMTWVKPGLPGPCTNPDPSVVREGRKSFPSGHSSLAFSGWVYLALFLYDFLGAFLPPVGNEGGQVWTLFVATMPTLGAVLVGCSRVSDYWHHPTDVMAGAALGTLCAFLSYAQHRAACHFTLAGHNTPSSALGQSA